MNKSESITNLAVALVKFNGEIGKVAKDASNPFFKNKYATLDNIIDEARPILTKNGLSIIQIPSGDGVNVIIKTLMIHESGEWIETEELIMKPVKNDPQAIGSCLTYMRRYSLTSFLSLNTGEDDDGHKATEPQGKPVSQSKPQPTSDKISEGQLKRLFAITGKEHAATAKAVMEGYGYSSSKDILKKDYESIIKDIESAVKGA